MLYEADLLDDGIRWLVQPGVVSGAQAREALTEREREILTAPAAAPVEAVRSDRPGAAELFFLIVTVILCKSN